MKLCKPQILLFAAVVLAAAPGLGKEKDEVLRTIAMTHRANRDRIVTWEGKVQIVERFTGDDGPVETRYEVEFALDRTRNLLRWEWFLVGGDDRGLPKVFAGIRASNAFSLVERQEPEDRTVVLTRPAHNFRPGFTSRYFHPFFHFESLIGLVDEHFEGIYSMSDNPSVRYELRQNGTLTEYSTSYLIGTEAQPSGSQAAKFVFDLTRGGVLLEHSIRELNADGGIIYGGRLETDYEEHNGCWVPSKGVYLREEDGGKSHSRHFDWIEQAVNEPLKRDFNLESIGVRDGDHLVDFTSDSILRFDNGKLLPTRAGAVLNPSPEPSTNQKFLWILVIVNMLALAVFLVFLRKRKKKV